MINTIIQGVLLGGYYALIAAGLSLLRLRSPRTACGAP